LKYIYFPGCVIPQRENAYELSARKICKKLGIELIELKEANCCGFFLDAVDHLSSTILAAKNLSLADEIGYNLLTLCPACFGHLMRVKTELMNDQKLMNTVNKALGEINKQFRGTSEATHISKVLVKEVGIKKLKETVTKPLEQLRVAPHYGCHILKPSDELQFDSPENPKLLDSLIEATGAKCLNYMEKRLCCGAPIMGVDDNLSLQIVREKFKAIQKVGADLIVTVCPFCHTHFDLNQPRVEEMFSEKYQIPVLHYTQLLGLAQGFTADELGLYENRVPVDNILNLL
jgi:heterodisulfide reductase subunit B